MQLPHQDALHYHLLQKSLLWFANERLGVVPRFAAPAEVEGGHDGSFPDSEEFAAIRDACRYEPALLDAFLKDGPFPCTPEDEEIVSSWRYGVTGQFLILRHEAEHSIFLSGSDPQVAYGVLGLADALPDLLPRPIPCMAFAWLLPFKGKIIHDGFLRVFPVRFGSGALEGVNRELRIAERNFGIVTSLPRQQLTPRPKPRPKEPHELSASSEAAQKRLLEIVELTDRVCRDNLDDEYRDLCRKIAEQLACEKPCPLTRGKPTSWAAGILHAVAWVNGLQRGNVRKRGLRVADIDNELAVSNTTSHAKSKDIRERLEIDPLDPEWRVLGQPEPTSA